jgi:hypothetical protein
MMHAMSRFRCRPAVSAAAGEETKRQAGTPTGASRKQQS